MATGGNRTNATTVGSTGGDSGDSSSYDDGGGGDNVGDGADGDDGGDESDSAGDDVDDISSLPLSVSIPISHRKMMRRVRRFGHSAYAFSPREVTTIEGIPLPLATGDSGDDGTSSSSDFVAGSQNGAQNARKTGATKPVPKSTPVPKKDPPTKTTSPSDSKCTPSPSKPLPASASKL